MARAGGNPNIVEAGKNTRFPHNDPTKGGRKPSIRKQLGDLMLSDGQVVIPADQVVQTRPDGSIVIKVPTEMQLAMKLKSLAMGKGNTAIQAMRLIMDHIDGRPGDGNQLPPGGSVNYNTQINIEALSPEAALEIKNLYRIARGEEPIDDI